MGKVLSRILFPLRTNIKSLQRWGKNDISERIKQSIILYDEIIVETGTYSARVSNLGMRKTLKKMFVKS